MKIAIIGGGEVGRALVNSLSKKKHKIIVVDKDEETIESFAEMQDVLAIKGDGSKIEVLKDAGIDKVDVVITNTDDDTTNLMICEVALNLKIKKIIARVNNAGNEELFEKLGINTIVSKVQLITTSIENALVEEGNYRLLLEFGKGDIKVIEVEITKDSPLIGKDVELSKAIVLTLYREGEYILPKGSYKIKEGDVIVFAVKSEDIDEVLSKIYK